MSLEKSRPACPRCHAAMQPRNPIIPSLPGTLQWTCVQCGEWAETPRGDPLWDSLSAVIGEPVDNETGAPLPPTPVLVAHGASHTASGCPAVPHRPSECGTMADQPERGSAETRVAIARRVAEHWRSWAMQFADADTMPIQVIAHPLCLVIAALDGETDLDQLGIRDR